MTRLSRRSGDVVAPAPIRVRALRFALFGLATASAFGVVSLLGTSLSGRPTVDRAPSWSPSGEWLVFAAERDGQSDLYVSRPDGSDRRPLADTPGADERAPAFSPDGQRVVFESNRSQDDDIYVMELPAGRSVRLTNWPGRDLSPAWSPDGASIAFASQRDGRAGFDLYTMSTDGTGVRRLTSADANAAPDYSRGGAYLLADVNQQIRLLDLASLASRPLTFAPQDGRQPAWHPDDLHVAFVTTRRGRGEIFTMTRDGQDQQPLVSMAGSQVSSPRWSPDGTRLAFVRTAGRDVDAKGHLGERAIYVMEIASGRLWRVSP